MKYMEKLPFIPSKFMTILDLTFNVLIFRIYSQILKFLQLNQFYPKIFMLLLFKKKKKKLRCKNGQMAEWVVIVTQIFIFFL
jgi:hypothetical protein